MTSFFRRSLTLLVTGGAVLGSWAAMGFNALALTQAQIVDQLDAVPVFTITNNRGIPFVAEIPSQDENVTPTTFTEVFISHEDAETSLELLREQDPELGRTAQITPVSLGRIYEVALRTREANNPLEFLFVPILEEVEYAMSLPTTDNESSGVPLFMVSSPTKPNEVTDDDDEDKISLLTLKQGEEEIVPLFFRQDQFDGIISSLQETEPDVAANLELRVIWLEDFIGILERADDANDDVQQYQMIPLPESIAFAQSFTPFIPEGSSDSE